jgi:chromosome partitioning protein
MRNIITVMNTKGGVGKSTLVLALADTLSVHHGKKVLVIDSDGHASVSNMLTPHAWLEAMQAQGRTIVDYLIAAVLGAGPVNWCEFTVSGVSDVDDAHSIDLLPGGGHLTLFEREVSRCESEGRLRRTIRSFLADVRGAYDFVLIDSAPGLSVLTECWLREADYCLSPTKPDYISIRGLQFLGEFRQRDPHIGFAEWLGVVINLKDQQSPADEHFDRWLRQDASHHCFEQSILRASSLEAAAQFSPHQRSYWAKYPGQTGKDLCNLTREVLGRLAQAGAGPPGEALLDARYRAGNSVLAPMWEYRPSSAS